MHEDKESKVNQNTKSQMSILQEELANLQQEAIDESSETKRLKCEYDSSKEGERMWKNSSKEARRSFVEQLAATSKCENEILELREKLEDEGQCLADSRNREGQI